MTSHRHLRNDLINALESEWDNLAARASTRAAFARWEQTHRVLDGLSRCDEAAVNYLRAAGDGALHALLQIAQSSDRDAQLAARVLLQLMLPAVCGLLTGRRGRYVRDADEAIEALWTTIRTFPLHRQDRITANLYLEMVHLLSRCPQPPHEVPLLAHDQTRAQVNPSEELRDLLVWAVQREVLDRPTAQLLLDRYSPADPEAKLKDSTRAAAQHHQLSSAALRKRCSRAIATLSVAVQEYGYTPRGALIG